MFVAVGGPILKILQGGPEFEVTPLSGVTGRSQNDNDIGQIPNCAECFDSAHGCDSFHRVEIDPVSVQQCNTELPE